MKVQHIDNKPRADDNNKLPKTNIDDDIKRLTSSEKPQGFSDLAWENLQRSKEIAKIPYLKMNVGEDVDAIFDLERLKTGNDKIFRNEPDKPKRYWDWTIINLKDEYEYLFGASEANSKLIQRFLLQNKGKPKVLRITKVELPDVPQPRYRITDPSEEKEKEDSS